MSANQQPVPGHGATAIEQAILDRFDRGLRPVDIAEALNLKLGRVQTVIGCFQEGRSDQWASAAKRSSRDLLAAIRRSGAAHA